MICQVANKNPFLTLPDCLSLVQGLVLGFVAAGYIWRWQQDNHTLLKHRHTYMRVRTHMLD